MDLRAQIPGAGHVAFGLLQNQFEVLLLCPVLGKPIPFPCSLGNLPFLPPIETGFGLDRQNARYTRQPAAFLDVPQSSGAHLPLTLLVRVMYGVMGVSIPVICVATFR